MDLMVNDPDGRIQLKIDILHHLYAKGMQEGQC